MRSAPTLLALMLSATMAAALAMAIALGTRARRRELASLPTLGCTGAQPRSTVRWHALAVVAVGSAADVFLTELWFTLRSGLRGPCARPREVNRGVGHPVRRRPAERGVAAERT